MAKSTTIGRREPSAAATHEAENSGPLRKHRTWTVPAKAGNLEQQLERAGFGVQLRAIGAILDRCRTGAKPKVTAFEVTRELSPQTAKDHLRKEGFVPCCACVFVSWAIGAGNDVNQETTWITEAVQKDDKGKPIAVALSNSTVYVIGMPTLKAGMMLLAVTEESARKHREGAK